MDSLTHDAIDYASDLAQIMKTEATFLRGAEDLNTAIDPRDGMLGGNGQYYFRCGRSALALIDDTLRIAGRRRQTVERILDFACGYGRVLRWLLAAFPDADVSAVDTDANAVAAVSDLFDIDARIVKADWSDLDDDTFDLIWIGSLFTHLSEDRCRKLLDLLGSRLRPGGILAATMHGPYVAGRIKSGEKLYGLESARAAQLVAQFEATGFGFCEYQKGVDYGISVNNLAKLESIATGAHLTILSYVRRGWVQHQDFFACIR